MRDEFVALQEWILAAGSIADPVPAAEEVEVEAEPVRTTQEDDDISVVLMQARRFRAALLDAVDVACGELLTEIAVDVLGRELDLRPVDLQAIVSRATARYAFDEPLAVRLHPTEIELLNGAYPVVPDACLRRGDAVIELRIGSIDARLGVRLESVLRSLA